MRACRRPWQRCGLRIAERRFATLQRGSSLSLKHRKITDKIESGRTAEAVFQKKHETKSAPIREMLFADEDEEEIESELNKTITSIREDLVEAGFTPPSDEELKHDKLKELHAELSQYAKEGKNDFSEGNIPGLERLRPEQPLLPDRTEQLEMLFEEFSREHKALEADANEVDTWPEWHAYELESDLEEDRIRDAWENSPEPITPESASALAKEITEMDIAVRTKWVDIAAARFRREMARGLHPRMAEEVAELKKEREIKPRPVQQIVPEPPPPSPAEKAVLSVQALLPEG